MSDESPEHVHSEAGEVSKRQQHRFLLMVFGAVGVSLVLVFVALSLYINSTAIELDLSRPAYKSVRDQAGKDMQATSYPSTGTLDETAIQTFRQMYKEQYDKTAGTTDFDSDALSDRALELPAIK